MCGFLIIKKKNYSKNLKNKFLNSLHFMRNRGPDESTHVELKDMLIGFNRLSINNINNGSQPFSSKCGRYILVFNGEILNFKDLIKSLKKQKIKFDFENEIETILNLYILHGESCVKFFRGFFSIVIIDKFKNSIFAAVDRMGIKPLYYCYEKKKNQLIITSDYSHLNKYKIIDLKLKFNVLRNFVCLGRNFRGETIYNNIFELPQASIMNFNERKGITIKKYWRPFRNHVFSKKKLVTTKLLENKLLKINKIWQISETKISSTLSSGVDSNLINYTFKKNRRKIKNFSIYETSSQNLKKKNIISEKINYKQSIRSLENFTKINKNPFVLANPGSIALFQLYSKIKKFGYKVSFTGEGADELFGGYERYRRQYNLLQTREMKFNDHLIELYKREVSLFEKTQKILPKKKIKKGLLDDIASIKCLSKNIKNKILEFDQLTWLNSLLRKHDVIGMNYSIEVRPSFLDNELLNFVNNEVNPNFKFNESKNKILLKDILLKKLKINYHNRKKLGTKSLINHIFNNKDRFKKFKKDILHSNFLKKIFNLKTLKNKKFFVIENYIFLWRLFILSKMFHNKQKIIK